MGLTDRLTDLTVAIDKTEKIGFEAVKNELRERGFSDGQLRILEPILMLEGSPNEKLCKLEGVLQASKTGTTGIVETRKVLDYAAAADVNVKIELDLSLARGLDYYTGAIMEVKADGAEIGSVCGGGRYDNLTGIFGLKDISGVGVSFGADRIYDVLAALDLFPEHADESSRVMFANMGDEEEKYCMRIVKALRADGIAVELFPEKTKLRKQLEYADKKGVPFTVVIGGDEMKAGTAMLRDMRSKVQSEIPLTAESRAQLISMISTV